MRDDRSGLDGEDASKQMVERERAELREFVADLSGDEIRSGGWFTKLSARALNSYTAKVDWKYFQDLYPGVPADVIVEQRIRMAARYAALEGGVSASAYSAAIVTTLGSLGGASPATLPAAATTVMIDLAYITRLQLRLAYDIAVLYRIPIDLSDPDDMWKIIRVAFTIKSGEAVRGGVTKAVPALMRPLIKRYYSGSVLAAARSFPVVGKYLLQRNAIKIGIPLVGVPLTVGLNRYTTIVAGRHARAVFRNEARIFELAQRLTDDGHHAKMKLWIAWLVILADGKASDDEALLMRHLVTLTRERHDVVDEELSQVIEVDPARVWCLLDQETEGLGALVDVAERVARVDGDLNARERHLIAELKQRCQ